MELNLYNTLKDPEKLMELLKEADIATISLVLSHLTADLSYVDKIKPFVKGAFDYSVNVPEDDANFIREKLIEVLQKITNKNNNLNSINNIKEEHLSYIMSAGVGAEIKDEYIPMMKEELGFNDNSIRDECINNIKKHESKPNVIIIGSGLCGILAGIKLSKAEIPFIIIEKNDSIGGTWYENTYPGCGVDTPNHVYAYSFEPSFHWEEFYSKRDAILNYLKKCVKKYNLFDHIQLNTTVESTVFNEITKSWDTSIISNNKKSILNSNIVISAVGQLNKPSIPNIKGIGEFNGPIIHTGAWDDNFDYKDKNIALIGTGASGMQVANPNYHRKLSKGKKWVLENIPFYSRWYRLQLFWGFCDGIHASLYKDPNWKFPDRSLNHTNERFRVNMVKHIESIIGNDKELLNKVIPNYPPYGKRMLMDNNWFEMLKKDNVQLITDKVNSITNSSIETDEHSYKKDAIVMATGFKASKMIWPIKVVGKKGINLNDFWNNDNPKAHVGITVPNFPNFFIMYGPNTNLAHGGSIVFHGECQIRYILGCINLLLEKKYKIMDCMQEPFEKYNSKVDAEHSKMVWTHDKVNSWYRNGTGRVITNSPWRLVDYWNFTKEPIEQDYKFN